ncbi:MAG: hypothetical protein Q9211_000985 [Gyalolechia sp. 1 TL-2023]
MATSSQQLSSTASFPFEKLPPEIQMMVLREAMPPHGLVPWHPLIFRRTDVEKPSAIPLSLFRVNKSISAAAQYIAQKEVHLVVEVSPDYGPHPDRIKVLGLDLKGLANFWSHSALARIRHFRKMRNFELRLMTDHARPWGDVDQVYFECREYKEKLRIISDTLATNPGIQHIIVQVPCLCSLDSDEKVQLARSKLLDFLSPLRRLRVTQPVTFRVTHENDHPEKDRRDPIRTEDLKQVLRANFGDLVGENLSTEETMWRNIKAKDRTELYAAADSDVDHKLWELFETLNDYPENFARHARRVKAYWSRKLRAHRNQR